MSIVPLLRTTALGGGICWHYHLHDLLLGSWTLGTCTALELHHYGTRYNVQCTLHENNKGRRGRSNHAQCSISLVGDADAGQRVQVRPNAAFNSSTMGWNLGMRPSPPPTDLPEAAIDCIFSNF